MGGLEEFASAVVVAAVILACVDHAGAAGPARDARLTTITKADAVPGTTGGTGARLPQSAPLVFTRNLTTPVGMFRLVARVPVGSYLVSYSVYVESQPEAPLGSLACFVQAQNGEARRYVAESYVETTGPHASVSGAGLTTKSESTGEIALFCKSRDAAVPFISYSGEPSSEPVQLVLIPVGEATAAGPGY